MLPDNYTLSARISPIGDDWTDIEMRSETEKYTVASVEGRFAHLFLAAPKLLAACKLAADLIETLIVPGSAPKFLIDAIAAAEKPHA